MLALPVYTFWLCHFSVANFIVTTKGGGKENHCIPTYPKEKLDIFS